MRCSHCQSLMFEAEIVREGHTELTWYECPTCGRCHLCSCRVDVPDFRNQVLGYRRACAEWLVARSDRR